MSTQSTLAPSTSILIVDDDSDIAPALQDLLEYEGYQVHSVPTGARRSRGRRKSISAP